MDSNYDELLALQDDLEAENSNTSDEFNNLENIPNTPKKVEWTIKDIRLLLNVRLDMESEFKKGEKSRNTLWNIVLRKMLEQNPQFKLDANSIKRKFNNMLITYRRIKDRKNKTGRANVHWTFFDEFDKVYGQRHDIEAPKNLLFDSSNVNYAEESTASGEQMLESAGPSKRIKRSSAINEILNYWKEEDEKESKRHDERMKVDKEKNEIEREKNEIEREKTQCLRGIQDILSKLVGEYRA